MTLGLPTKFRRRPAGALATNTDSRNDVTLPDIVSARPPGKATSPTLDPPPPHFATIDLGSSELLREPLQVVRDPLVLFYIFFANILENEGLSALSDASARSLPARDNETTQTAKNKIKCEGGEVRRPVLKSAHRTPVRRNEKRRRPFINNLPLALPPETYGHDSAQKQMVE